MAKKDLLKKLENSIEVPTHSPEMFEASKQSSGRGKLMMGARIIERDLIIPDPSQPRLDIDESSEEFLLFVDAIKRDGIKTPINVYFDPDSGNYHIIAGERRWTAASDRHAGLKEIPCIITDKPGDSEKMRLQLSENIHRKNLSDIEIAFAIEEYKSRKQKETGKKPDLAEIDSILKINIRRRQQLSRILKLPEVIQNRWIKTRQRKFTERYSRMLHGMSEETQLKAFEAFEANPEMGYNQWTKICEDLNPKKQRFKYVIDCESKEAAIKRLKTILEELEK